MAKDDYNVLAYKILIYLYAVLKREIVFDENTFKHTVLRDTINEDYLDSVLKMMQDSNLIQGLVFTPVWGGECILSNDYNNMKITVDGINYLSDNSKMQQVKAFLIENTDIFASLIKLIFPS